MTNEEKIQLTELASSIRTTRALLSELTKSRLGRRHTTDMELTDNLAILLRGQQMMEDALAVRVYYLHHS